MSDEATHIFHEIRETQENLRALNASKSDLERQLAEVQQNILTDIDNLSVLQDRLNKALNAANIDAAEQKDDQ